MELVEASSVRHVSKTGARGIYQIKESTWRQYSERPHEWANELSYVAQAEARRVALRHAHWIVESAFPALGLPVTPYSFALVWHPGFGNVAKLNLSPANVDYAKRFENLYEELEQQK